MKSLKAFVAVFICVLIAYSAEAQTKGNLLVGGGSALNMSFMSDKIDFDGDLQDGGKTSNISFTPIIGYLFTNNLAAGIELPFAIQSYKDENDDKESITTMAIAPFVRYYFGASNVKPFLHGGIGIGNTKYKTDENGSESETVGLSVWQVGGGVAMFVNENISVDLGLSYGSSTQKFDEGAFDYKETSSGIGADIGFVLFF